MEFDIFRTRNVINGEQKAYVALRSPSRIEMEKEEKNIIKRHVMAYTCSCFRPSSNAVWRLLVRRMSSHRRTAKKKRRQRRGVENGNLQSKHMRSNVNWTFSFSADVVKKGPHYTLTLTWTLPIMRRKNAFCRIFLFSPNHPRSINQVWSRKKSWFLRDIVCPFFFMRVTLDVRVWVDFLWLNYFEDGRCIRRVFYKE